METIVGIILGILVTGVVVAVYVHNKVKIDVVKADVSKTVSDATGTTDTTKPTTPTNQN